jgi:alginate O-acetyltransferase complex protein AlgI
MLYNSLEFAAFLGVIAGLYHVCPLAWRRWYLLIASYAFYCTWSVPFAFLLLAVTGVAYVLARRINDASSEEERRAWLSAGLVLLLLPLVTFKYSAWFGGAAAWVVGERSWTASLRAVSVLAPVGISYYTLKLVGYVIDVYWGRLEPCRDFSALATYAAFFPQTLAGPIQRAGDFLDRVTESRRASLDMVGSGVWLILFGLFKKLVLADRLGVVVDQVFAHPDAFSGRVLAAGSYLFAIQLYADFSGLTDIAIGAGRVIGISAPQNFDAPFFAPNVQDFWRRWHMTLTSWLTDYLFMPLRMGLRALGQVGLITSLMVNMVAVGIWHGASLNFVIFGLLQGVYMVGSSLTLRKRRKLYERRGWDKIHSVTGPIVTFHMIVVSLVFFRARSLPDAWYILGHAGGEIAGVIVRFGTGIGTSMLPRSTQLPWGVQDICVAAGALVLMETLHLLRRSGQLSNVALAIPPWIRLGGCYALIVLILLWGQADSKQFIYAQF